MGYIDTLLLGSHKGSIIELCSLAVVHCQLVAVCFCRSQIFIRVVDYVLSFVG